MGLKNRGEAGKKSSIDIIAGRSDYKRGKQDGLAEAVELVNARAAELQARFDANFGEADEEFRATELARINGMYLGGKWLWMIYRRRQV